MKNLLPWYRPICALILLGLALPSVAKAQCCIWDSLLVIAGQSPSGSSGFYDSEEWGVIRYDATGDGINELVTTNRNENGLAATMHVIDLTTEAEIMTIDLGRIRQELVMRYGYPPVQVAKMKFRGFLKITNGTAAYERIPIFMSRGELFLYDPDTDYLAADPPGLWQVLAIDDFTGDGWPDIIMEGGNDENVIVAASQFSPSVTG